jgi:hypothetical protein
MKGLMFKLNLLGKKIHILSPSMLALTKGFGPYSIIPSTHLCV